MDTDALRSPPSSESQDELGSGLWMVGDIAPQTQEEDQHPRTPEQKQTGQERSSLVMTEEFPSPPPPSTGEGEMDLSSGIYSRTGDQEWPPVPTQADQTPTEHHCESPEGSDSIVFLSEDSEDQWIDSKPLDFTSAREQWVRRDSSSAKSPTPAVSRSSSRGFITEESLCALSDQQGELDVHNLARNQETQQVCAPAPPLETVASERAANLGPGSPTCCAVVVEEALTEAGRRECDRESQQTDRERKQTVSGSGTVDTGKEGESENLDTANKKLTSTDAPQRVQTTNTMDSDLFEDKQSENGVSADFFPNGSSEISSTFSPDPNETPIEREIRLAIKREQSLRRSRGLEPEKDKAKEFVEIPLRKPILSQELPLKFMMNDGKDRQFAGKKMQQEIRAEVEREKVLVQLGRLPGFYDKGTVRQLRDRKLLFEAFQEPKDTLGSALQNKRPSSASPCETPNGGIQAETSGTLKERTRSLELLDQKENPNHSTVDGRHTWTFLAPNGPGLTEGTKGQVIILENTPLPVAQASGPLPSNASSTVVNGMRNGKSFSVKPYCSGQAQNQDQDIADNNDNDVDSATLQENPFFKLRSSLSLRPDVQQDIREAREREKELRKQRTSLYGWGSETEGARAFTNPPSTHNNPNTPERSTKTSVTITSTSVRQSLGKLDLTWPPPAQDELRAQSEVQKSPKRQRSALLQRWENGLVNGHTDLQD